jgi:hypothetical protein
LAELRQLPLLQKHDEIEDTDMFLFQKGSGWRLIRHENIFAAHRSHLYQLLANESGISHVKVSTGYTVAQLLINLFIIAMAGQVALGYQLVVSVGIVGALVAVYFYLKGNRRRATDDGRRSSVLRHRSQTLLKNKYFRE